MGEKNYKNSSTGSGRAKKKWPNRTSCVSAGEPGGVYAIFAFNCIWLANRKKRKIIVEKSNANGHQISHHQSMYMGWGFWGGNRYLF